MCSVSSPPRQLWNSFLCPFLDQLFFPPLDLSACTTTWNSWRNGLQSFNLVFLYKAAPSSQARNTLSRQVLFYKFRTTCSQEKKKFVISDVCSKVVSLLPYECIKYWVRWKAKEHFRALLLGLLLVILSFVFLTLPSQKSRLSLVKFRFFPWFQ